MIVGVLVLGLLFASSGGVERVAETTVHFGRQEGCLTTRTTVAGAREGDAAIPHEWKLADGSFVNAVVTRDGTVEVERCACSEVGAAAVRVRIVRGKIG